MHVYVIIQSKEMNGRIGELSVRSEMSAYTGYKIGNQSVSEVHRSEEKGDTAQLSVPFSQRFLKHMKIEILSRW